MHDIRLNFGERLTEVELGKMQAHFKSIRTPKKAQARLAQSKGYPAQNS
jgi:hypothetical protein